MRRRLRLRVGPEWVAGNPQVGNALPFTRISHIGS